MNKNQSFLVAHEVWRRPTYEYFKENGWSVDPVAGKGVCAVHLSTHFSH